MSKSYSGKVALVTGANSGIGETIAASLLEAGATVYGLGRRQDALDAAKKRHPQVRWLKADVTERAEVQAAIAQVTKEAGRLDLVVNNAAIFAFAPLEQQDLENARAQFDINVLGSITVAQAALAALKDSKGSLINLSSAAGHKAVSGGSIYGATKAAIESLTRSWALELAPAGVRVNAVAPGPIDTPGFDKLGLPADVVPQVKQSFVKQVPLARMGSTEEIARWVVALGDPASAWVTGQVLSIDGGMSLS